MTIAAPRWHLIPRPAVPRVWLCRAVPCRAVPPLTVSSAIGRQAQELMERTSPEQAAALQQPLADINTRWDDLLKGIVERQRELDHALLRLGQFQHALDELLVWIGRTDKTLDGLRPVFGDPQVIEVELAKLKVSVNDIQAHQTSVDTLNDAGRQLIEDDRDSADASATHRKLNQLNDRWGELQDKTAGKQRSPAVRSRAGARRVRTAEPAASRTAARGRR